MKKYFILTSVLALTACGGGGGVGVVPGGPVRAAMTTENIESNREITSMASEVLVASGTEEPIARSATTSFNGKTYTAFRLNDVKLFTAENLDEDHPEIPTYMQLELGNNGRIEAVKMNVGGQESGRTVRDTVDTETFQGPVFEYVADGDDRALYRVVDNGQDMAALNRLATQQHLSGGHWNRVDERMAFETYGNDVDNDNETTTRLQYADFGYFNPVYRSKHRNLDATILGYIRQYESKMAQADATTDPDERTALLAEATNIKTNYLSRTDGDDEIDSYRDNTEFTAALAKQDYQLFAGGYAINGTTMQNTLVPENDTEYRGTAVGRVYASIQTKGTQGENRNTYLGNWDVPYDNQGNDGWTNDAGHDMAKAFVTHNARMVIGNDGSQTLTMPFNSDTSMTEHFYDVEIVKPASGATTVTFDDSTNSLANSMYRMNNSPDANKTEASFNPGYYGVNTPSEAAGTARYYTEQTLGGSGDNVAWREWEVQAAWGMKPYTAAP